MPSGLPVPAVERRQQWHGEVSLSTCTKSRGVAQKAVNSDPLQKQQSQFGGRLHQPYLLPQHTGFPFLCFHFCSLLLHPPGCRALWFPLEAWGHRLRSPCTQQPCSELGAFLATWSLSEAFTSSCSVRSWWLRRCGSGLGAGNLTLKCITNKKDTSVSESPCLVCVALVKSCVQCVAGKRRHLQNYPARGLSKFHPENEWPHAVC